MSLTELARTGFCRMKGSGDIHIITRQSEELLAALHREGVTRLYLFDGDQKPNENYIKKIKKSQTGEPIPLAFLEKPEIENYLLDKEAIAAAINEELASAFEGTSPSGPVEPTQVGERINEALAQRKTKGSEILSHIYEHVGLRFKKTVHGRLIATHTTPERNPSLKELAGLLKDLFSTATDSPK